jgi:hypothetical protein
LPYILNRYYQSFEDPITNKFTQLFSELYKNHIKKKLEEAGHEDGLVMSLFLSNMQNFKKQLLGGIKSPMAPHFFALITSLNQSIIRNFNHTLEIGLYIDSRVKSGVEFESSAVLSYTSDKERLEIELRKNLLMRAVFGKSRGEIAIS